jgi:asparagine synthase (glutamine-hydrolysing)
MAPRFLAIQFNAKSAEDTATAARLVTAARRMTGWRCSLDADGLIVFDDCSDENAVQERTIVAGGVILGTVFPALDAPPVATSLEQTSDSGSQARAASMLRSCWGRYVAFFSGADGTSTILRDPSGKSACFILETEGSIRIACTEIEDLLPLVGHSLAIDWSYLDRFLLGEAGASRGTAVRDVSELFPGECFTMRNGQGSVALLWDPATFAVDRIDDFEEAARIVRRTGQFCADRWSERHRRIVLSLSGGLDSSVMAGLLKRAPTAPHVLCRNLYSDLAEADERRFAHLVAEMHGFPLVTGQHGVTSMDLEATFQDTPITLNPSRAFTTVAAVKDRQKFLDGIGADSFWSGFGGDQAFSAERNPSLARDYVLNAAVPFRVLQVARDAAEISGKSIGTTLRLALAPRTASPPPLHAVPTFYAERLQQRPSAGAGLHPLARNCGQLPPAKLGHVLATVHALGANPFGKVADRPVVDFFASQPLLEACLRVPSYVHNRNGVRRSLQRHAFGDLLPEAVRDRRGKGSAAADIAGTLLRPANVAFMRSRIGGGLLAERGLLDPQRTRRLLAFERPPAIQDMNALLTCLAAEDWLSKTSYALSR